MQWTWDPRKNETNKGTHGLRFETARLVFDDPHAASRRDPFPGEPRWQTIGMVGNVVLLVVHTHPEPSFRVRRRNRTHHQCSKGNET